MFFLFNTFTAFLSSHLPQDPKSKFLKPTSQPRLLDLFFKMEPWKGSLLSLTFLLLLCETLCTRAVKLPSVGRGSGMEEARGPWSPHVVAPQDGKGKHWTVSPAAKCPLPGGG